MNYKCAGITSVLYLVFQVIASPINGQDICFLLLISIFPYLLFRLKHLLNNRYNYKFADLPIRIVVIVLFIGFLLFTLQVFFINSNKLFAVILFIILFTRGLSYILLGLALAIKGHSLLSMRFKLLGYIFTFFGLLQLLTSFPNLMFILPKAITPFAKGYLMIYIKCIPLASLIAPILLFGCLAYIFLSRDTQSEDSNNSTPLSD